MLDVSRGTLREALAILEREGWSSSAGIVGQRSQDFSRRRG